MTEPWNDFDPVAMLASTASDLDRADDHSHAGDLDRAVQALRDSGQQTVAGAAMVNRTRRVVRERARILQVRKSRMRSLYIPLLVSAGLLAAVVFALWSVLEGYEAINTGLPDASQQILVLLMWCLPVSAALLAAVWVRRAGAGFDDRASNRRPQ